MGGGARFRRYFFDAAKLKDVAKAKELSIMSWRIGLNKKCSDASRMIADAGANGCKPVDRRTKYVNVNTILGEGDHSGVTHDHLRPFTQPTMR